MVGNLLLSIYLPCQAQQVGTTGLTQSEIDHWKELSTEAQDSEGKREEIIKELEKTYPDAQAAPEAMRMLYAICNGSMMGGNDGWFGPSQTVLDWEWVSGNMGKPGAESISMLEFDADMFLFERMDRDRNQTLTPSDFDWSNNSPWVQRFGMVSNLFRTLDREGNNRVSEKELTTFFDEIRDGKEGFSLDDLAGRLLAAPREQSNPVNDAPTPKKLLEGLFKSELGSLHEGPLAGDFAPDFTLKTEDETQTIHLKEELGSKPIVLIFGNFSCGPFRRTYPEIEDIHQRFKDRAKFFGVYVREAHPEEGWVMESNTRMGVKVFQPKTYSERVGIATQCRERLNYTMPLLVDEIDDPVGNAYSGMPARFYIINSQGIVLFKSGRGPFGFKSMEMEQALAMALLTQ